MNVSTVAPSLAAQITNLPKLAMNDLWTIWDKYFPRRPPHNNRAYVEGRVAYKIQEEAFGTKLVVQTQMARIGEALVHAGAPEAEIRAAIAARSADHSRQ